MTKLDPRQLRVVELSRLLNSTPMGEVVGLQTLYRQMNKAGYRIGDGRRIDLTRYAAWLFHTRREPVLEKIPSYELHKEAANARSRMQSLSLRDIAGGNWIHAPVNPSRKEECKRSFRRFCECYFPRMFSLAWSKDHLKVIGKIEVAVLEGGLFAMAMPRGSGKTTLCETACLWALLYGHREFVALIGSDEEHAGGMLEAIKSEMENNELLEEDFSEVVGPIRALEGIHQRAAGQLYQGHRTLIGWTAKEILLPTIPGSAASGSLIRVAGITGRIRGMKHVRADGTSIRPSLVLLDDPQTDESARSPSQYITREQILSGAILGLAGPGRKIAGLMTLTVVRPEDMADRILDRDRNPQWQGERTKMVYQFPKNTSMWEEYARIRAEGQRNGTGTQAAREYYQHNRLSMDEGAVVAWEARHNPDELSAIQHAMNLKLDQGDVAFYAEYQNEPIVESTSGPDRAELLEKINGMERGVCKDEIEKITAFIDVGKGVLWWMVCGWKMDFTGQVLDYGAWPKQRTPYYSAAGPHPSLEEHYRKGPDGSVFAGLTELFDMLQSLSINQVCGTTLTFDQILVDQGWNSKLVREVIRGLKEHKHINPSMGVGLRVGQTSISDYIARPGERIGDQWILQPPGPDHLRAVRFDANRWKSNVARGLKTAIGNAGAITINGKGHEMLLMHLTSETSKPVEANGTSVEIWTRKPNYENHWWDCLVGNAVAASMAGVTSHPTVINPTRKRLSPEEYLRKWNENARAKSG